MPRHNPPGDSLDWSPLSPSTDNARERSVPHGIAKTEPFPKITVAESVQKRKRRRSGRYKPTPLPETLEEASKTTTVSTLAFKGFFVRRRPKVVTSNDVQGASAKQQASSWTLSLAIHAAIVLTLAFLFFPGKPKPPEVVAVFSNEIGDQLDFLTNDEGNLNPNEAEQYELTVPEEFKIDDLIVDEEKELPFDANVNAPSFEQTRVEITEALSGRTDPGLKNDLLAKYGGNRKTEEAVDAGLRWLVKQQNKDGSWSIRGPYSDGIVEKIDNRPAATALALLAFQGAGNTRSSGKYSAVVSKGWKWLLKQQRADGCFTPEQHFYAALFYTHALCTIALCELITLEKKGNSALRKQAQLAVDYLLEGQDPKLGGWRYVPREESDLSVTGWCLMALRTSEMAGLKVPQRHYAAIEDFLNRVSYDDGAGFVYQLDRNGKISDSEKRPSMTATGLMCRKYLGVESNDEALIRGAQYLTEPENLIHFPNSQQEEKNFSSNVYGWYSTSMALKGLGPYNKYWRKWNAAMSTELPKWQEAENSPEAGSWNPQFDEYGFGGGRLYVTCLSILCLEVYYRHLSFTP